jgi:hypothetical protein
MPRYFFTIRRQRMALIAHISRMQRRHFPTPTTQSEGCENRAATRMICL